MSLKSVPNNPTSSRPVEPSAAPAGPSASARGALMYDLVRELYPICRSITGNGVRQTLQIIGRALGPELPLQVSEIPSGTDVLDWTVPKEWNIKGGWIQKLNGERVIDFERCNL